MELNITFEEAIKIYLTLMVEFIKPGMSIYPENPFLLLTYMKPDTAGSPAWLYGADNPENFLTIRSGDGAQEMQFDSALSFTQELRENLRQYRKVVS